MARFGQPEPPQQEPATAGNPSDSQRTFHAGWAFVLVVGTLLLAALLNADALVRDARTMPYGNDRDIWLAVWMPFQAVSDTLRLDKPRAAVDHVTGRDGDGSASPIFPVSEVAASEGEPAEGLVLGPPSPTAVAIVPTATPVTVRIPSRSAPLRLWVGGDSLAGIFGESLIRLASDTGVIDATLDYRISTGLSRPDYFNWPGELQRVSDETDPDVMVLVFGSNDSQGLLTPEGDVYQPLSDGWREEYRRRVMGTMNLVSRPGRLVLWIGLPPMRDGEFSQRLADIDQIYREEAAKHDGVSYIDARQVLGANGGYAAYLDDGTGRVELVREPDGVHLTRAGGNRLAGAVLYKIGSVVPLSPSVYADYRR
jgi:hypothetical protein